MTTSNPSLSAELLARVCEVVDPFDAAWQAVAEGATPPRIEDVLRDIPEADHLAFLRELLAVEFECRWRLGQWPTVEECLSRFPQHAEDESFARVLIETELRLRQQADPTVTLDAFRERFPLWVSRFAEWVREDPNSGSESSSTRRRRSWQVRLNCPHCHNPIELVVESVDDVTCPSCGSALHLDASQAMTWDKQRLPQIHQFELLEAVGRGAFGTVYKARDSQLQRLVAIKIPRSGVLATDEDEDRFLREARNAAQLQHPGIVTVFTVGRAETFPYLVSEFVEGVTLAQYLTAKRFTMREAARLIQDIALGLQHAHEHEVIHRDLKPSNVMLTPEGTPRIMDFGLAKRNAGEITMTLDGQILGTPAYMSPEQARGQAHQADARSDIYSVGAILFELLTGELPFRGDVRMLLNQVIHDEPPNPRRLNDQIPRDLDTICLKCLEKESARRYATAGELADDLRRFLADEPIHARPVSRFERAWRWCRRNPTVAGLAGVAVLMLLLTAVVSSVAYVRESRLADANERLADKERDAGQRARQMAETNATLAKEAKQQAIEATQLVPCQVLILG